MITTVIRRWATELTHVVTIPLDLLRPASVFGVSFTVIKLPVVTRCGRTLRGKVGIVMEVGTKVKCPQCRALSGIETQTEASYAKRHSSKG